MFKCTFFPRPMFVSSILEAEHYLVVVQRDNYSFPLTLELSWATNNLGVIAQGENMYELFHYDELARLLRVIKGFFRMKNKREKKFGPHSCVFGITEQIKFQFHDVRTGQEPYLLADFDNVMADPELNMVRIRHKWEPKEKKRARRAIFRPGASDLFG